MNFLLQALEDAKKQVDYFALDLSGTELESTLARLPEYKHVSCRGLLGTYDDGREWLKEPRNTSRQKCILSLGSSIGRTNPRWVNFFGARADVRHRKLLARRGCRLPEGLFQHP